MGFTLKLTFISAAALSTAVMFKLLSPHITYFAISDLSTIWTSFISWLKPPYLYVVINCIIITIMATSLLQSKLDDSQSSRLQTEPVEVVAPVELPPSHESEVLFHSDVLGDEPGSEPEIKVVLPMELPPTHESDVMFHSDVLGDEPGSAEPEFSTPKFTDNFIDEDAKIGEEAYEEIDKTRVDKSVISMSGWTSLKINEVGLSNPKKPPASARFSHRKPPKAIPEGGRIAKPKRADTLDATWKAITESRSKPFTRHLRKSDTWETHTQNRNSERMTKSETVQVNRRSGGSGRLRKEPSLGQEELNRRVEAFINKFNEDMRLQRQESLNRYKEMVNRGAH